MATPDPRPESMVGFGPKQAWLAIRDGDAELTMAVLGLRDLGPVSWRAGMDLAHLRDDRVVLTPALPGADGSTWLLVVGRWLVKSTMDTADLSELLGTEVQYFATHRVTEWHRWQRSRDGELGRSFEYLGESGEVLDWRGDPDSAERTVGLPATFHPDASTEPSLGEADLDGPDLGGPDLGGPDLGGPDLGGPDLGGADLGDAAGRNVHGDDDDLDGITVMVGEEDVFHVAGQWSLDPRAIEGLPASGPLRAAAAP